MHVRIRTDFNRLWFAQTVSVTGRQLGALAVAILCVVHLDATAAEISLVTSARFAPYALLAPLAGRLVDRLASNMVMSTSQGVEALFTALVPVLLIADSLSIASLTLLALAAGTCEMTFNVAYRAALVEITGVSNLTTANAKLSVGESMAEAGGPGLGGVLIHLVGPAASLVAQAAAHVAAFASLLGIRRANLARRDAFSHPDGASRDSDRPTSFRRRTLRDPVLRACAGEAAMYNFFWQLAITLLPLYLIQHLGLGGRELGALLALLAVGALLGASLADRVSSRIGIGRALIGGAVIADIAPLAILVTPGGAASFWLLAPALVTQGVGLTLCNVHVTAIRQTIVGREYLGRATAAYTAITQTSLLCGAITAGALATLTSVEAAIQVSCTALTVTWIWLWFSPLRSAVRLHDLKEMP